VIVTFFILVLGLTPSLLSLWFARQTSARAEARLQMAIDSFAARGLSSLQRSPDQQYVEGMGYIIGDITCKFNARSSYIRCAVNPSGSCQDCPHYQQTD
jgi:ABC-type Mn2+/Zn2+ transport system permease subunit